MSTDIKVEIKKEIETEPEISFEAGIEGDCYFKISANFNSDLGNIIDLSTKFSGLIVKGYVKLSFKSKRNKDKTKDFKPFPLIPSSTEWNKSMKFN